MTTTTLEQPAKAITPSLRKVSLPDFSRIRRIAQDLLTVNGIEEPPVRAKSIAQNCGVHIVYAEFLDEHQGIAGLIECDGKTIVVNIGKTAEQCNYTIAHELGHSVLQHNICEASQDYHVLYCDLARQAQTLTEQEARFFAMHLLVPDFMLQDYLENFPFASNEQLANVFGVPVEILKLRRQYF